MDPRPRWYRAILFRTGKLKVPSIKLTLLGRSLLLVCLEVVANAVCWIIASRSHSIMGLAILAWTIGLRHALDADHISAIDNATRSLIGRGQLPVTCGLFFSLGHSTIVIVVNVAIVISTGIYNRIEGVGSIGSVIGPSVSGAFLLIIGLANTVILFKILRQRRQLQARLAAVRDEDVARSTGRAMDLTDDNQQPNMLMMRLLGPLINFVDRSWKAFDLRWDWMYPVGVVFGLGFDTASSIALLAISAIAKEGSAGRTIPPAEVVILPLLFTTGMTLIDSLDSILMLYSYSGFTMHSWAVFEGHAGPSISSDSEAVAGGATQLPGIISEPEQAETKKTEREFAVHLGKGGQEPGLPELEVVAESPEDCARLSARPEYAERMIRVKRHTMSGLSIILTTMSILLAFSIALIEIMGVIGGNCASCQRAAMASDGGGLAGRWWRGWARANDNSGYIGAAVVGAFILIVGGWYGVGWTLRRAKGKQGAS
ncbi:NicO-domain-containing protein [Leucogyrophana mollusca]|uniref:NicO-domain-containing protein n=1 Tax=Leucogyrophana mollusca TaxID=85980 RepID=A0ACB8BT43_9AGAM|nr:NicO-domain-containing protein [Leucogyrophana mollusca]